MNTRAPGQPAPMPKPAWRVWARLLAVAVYGLGICALLRAQAVEPFFPSESATEAKSEAPPPMRLAERVAIPNSIALNSADEGALDQLRAMKDWNDSGKRPTQIGFSRALPSLIVADLTRRADLTEEPALEGQAVRAMSKTGALVWGTGVKVTDAYGLRLHLRSVELPLGTRFWAWGPTQPPISFGIDLVSSTRELWTPAVFSDILFVEVEIPASAGDENASFEIAELTEIVPRPLTSAGDLSPRLPESVTCLQDATCFSPQTAFAAINVARHAVAQLQFNSGGQSYSCSGTLLNDIAGDGTPYLLTAHHCFSTSAEALTLEAYFDYYTSSCHGQVPPLSTLPRSNGATLLASGAVSDFTFVRLNGAPPGRAFMGWNASPSAIPLTTTLFRISHPLGIPQSYSDSFVDTFSASCQGDQRPYFIYSVPSVGATYEGSSGSAAMLAGGQVVGQLNGICPGVTDPCTETNEQSDGAFSITYQSIAQWLSPTSGAAPVASFTYAPTSPVVGQAIQFTDTSTGSPTSWAWNFGDGRGSADQNPSHAYSSNGTYTVTLLVRNANGSGEASHVITVAANDCFRCTRVVPFRPLSPPYQ